MNAQVDHVILTRFNLPSAGVEGVIRARVGWLRERLALFERYCLPSVLMQTNQFFHWIIYLDPESPDWLMERIEQLGSGGTFTPVYRTAVSNDELCSDLRAVSGARHNSLITTNLDNDDALALNFVARLQEAPDTDGRCALYLTRGLIRNGRSLYLRTDPSNAFCSVREDWEGARTCWTDWHNLLAKTMPVRELTGAPAWLQVIHGSNVSNRVRGRRVAAAPFASSFRGLLEGIEDPGIRDELWDAVVWRPTRFATETGRAAAKRTVLALGGKAGLDRVKSLTFRPPPTKSREINDGSAARGVR